MQTLTQSHQQLVEPLSLTADEDNGSICGRKPIISVSIVIIAQVCGKLDYCCGYWYIIGKHLPTESALRADSISLHQISDFWRYEKIQACGV